MTLPASRRCLSFFLISSAAVAALLAGALLAQTSPPSAGTAASTAGEATVKKAPLPAAAKAEPSEKSAVSYSLGVSMGEQLRTSGVGADRVSSERLAQGVRDALSGKVKLTDADRERISNLARSAYAAAGDTNHRAAAKFLAENSRKPDVVTTASGLQYKVIEPGSGDSPKPTDEVTVNYRGTLLDGTEFDSSYKRGQPVPFQVNRVIPGWSEALQLMKPGAKYQLFVPPQLAYDLRSPPAIPPGSLLIFEVELLSIKVAQPPAAQTGAQPAAAAQPAAPASAPPPK
jgi:FKBP-type peptidyl-prolyl cis-trans isomerase